MTNVSYILAGGIQAAQNRLTERIDHLNGIEKSLYFCSLLSLGIGAFLHYIIRAVDRENAEQEAFVERLLEEEP